MKVIMPSTTGGMYNTHRMRRLTGQGLMEQILEKEGRKPPTSLEPRDRKLGTLAKLDKMEKAISSPLLGKGRIRRGSGLEKLSGKLSELTIKPIKPEKHNITIDI